MRMLTIYVANLTEVIASLRLIFWLSLKDKNLALERDSLNILVSNAITEKIGGKYFNDLNILYEFKNQYFFKLFWRLKDKGKQIRSCFFKADKSKMVNCVSISASDFEGVILY